MLHITFVSITLLLGYAVASPIDNTLQTLDNDDWARTPSPTVTKRHLINEKRKHHHHHGCTLTFGSPTISGTISITGLPKRKTTFSSSSSGPYTYCVCPNDYEIATIEKGWDDVGNRVLYCAVDTYLGHPQTTLVPTATASPGDAWNHDWANVTCDTGSLKSILNNPWQQWNDSGAAAAWHEGVASFNKEKLDNVDLTTFLEDWFHAPPNYQCDLLGQDTCHSPPNCGQHSSPNAPVNSPAGYVIMNSIINLHAILDNFYGDLQSAAGWMALEAGNFVSTFSPLTEVIASLEEEKVILDGVSIGLGVLFALAFGSWFKATTWADQNPNYLAVLGSAAGAEANAAFSYIKDSITSLSTLPVQNNVTQYIGDRVTNWLFLTQKIATKLFNDSDTMYKAINHGQLLEPYSTDNALNLTTTIEQALFANALPLTWTAGTSIGQPFIANSAGVGSHCGVQPEDGPLRAWSVIPESDSIFAPSKFCDNGKAYWLLLGKSGKTELVRGGGEGNILAINEPPNLSNLDGHQWAGLKARTVFLNAVNNWRNAGHKNKKPTLSSFDTTGTLEQLAKGDLTKSPGLVNIPVCSFFEAGATGSEDPDNSKKNPYWPCPRGRTGEVPATPSNSASA